MQLQSPPERETRPGSLQAETNTLHTYPHKLCMKGDSVPTSSALHVNKPQK